MMNPEALPIANWTAAGNNVHANQIAQLIPIQTNIELANDIVNAISSSDYFDGG